MVRSSSSVGRRYIPCKDRKSNKVQRSKVPREAADEGCLSWLVHGGISVFLTRKYLFCIFLLNCLRMCKICSIFAPKINVELLIIERKTDTIVCYRKA